MVRTPGGKPARKGRKGSTTSVASVPSSQPFRRARAVGVNLFDLEDPEAIMRRARRHRAARGGSAQVNAAPVVPVAQMTRRGSRVSATSTARRPSTPRVAQSPTVRRPSTPRVSATPTGRRPSTRTGPPPKIPEVMEEEAAHQDQSQDTGADLPAVADEPNVDEDVAAAAVQLQADQEEAERKEIEAAKKEEAARKKAEAAAKKQAEKEAAAAKAKADQEEAERKEIDAARKKAEAAAKLKQAEQEAADAKAQADKEEAGRKRVEAAAKKRAEEEAAAAKAQADKEEAQRQEIKAAQKEAEAAAKKQAEQETAAAKAQADKEEAERQELEVIQKKAAEEKEEKAREPAERAKELAERQQKEQAERDAREKAEQKRLAKERAESEAIKKAGEERLAKEVAAKEQAAKEKNAARKKAAEEAVARKKAVLEAAAKEKADKDKAEKDKASAKVKAEEQEKFEKWIKSDGYLRQIEKEKKIIDEQVKIADEAAEAAKEKAEMLKKEERGFKKVTTSKRFAPEPKEDAPKKKAKTTTGEEHGECVDKESCKKFRGDMDLAKFKFDQVAKNSAPSGPVKVGHHMQLDTIFQALASVSEAINDARVASNENRLFGLFHPKSLVNHDTVGHPVVLQRHDAFVPIERHTAEKTHYSLVVLVQTQYARNGQGQDYFEMRHYDSDPDSRDAFNNVFAKASIKSEIISTGWAGRADEYAETLLGETQNIDCCDALPGQDWVAGIHVVLNGWVCALQLTHNKDALLQKAGFYENAVDLINLAIRGLVSSGMIRSFLDCYEYTMPDMLPETSRKGRWSKDSSKFRTYRELDDHIQRQLGRLSLLRPVDEEAYARQAQEENPPPQADTATSNNLPKTPVDKYFSGIDNDASLHQDDVQPSYDEDHENDNDSARTLSDVEMEEEDDESPVPGQVAPEEERVVYDFYGRRVTAESKAKAAAERAKKAAQKATQDAAQEAAQEAARQLAAQQAREASVELDDPNDADLFDADADINDLFNDDADVDELFNEDADIDSDGLYNDETPTSEPHTSEAQMQATVVDDEEEDLYSASPPRRQYATIPTSDLALPGPPPPTPHTPFAFPLAENDNSNPTKFAQQPPPRITLTPPPGLRGNETSTVYAPAPPPHIVAELTATRTTNGARRTNPHGTFTVPDTPPSSSGGEDEIEIEIPRYPNTFAVPDLVSSSGDEDQIPTGSGSFAVPDVDSLYSDEDEASTGEREDVGVVAQGQHQYQSEAEAEEVQDAWDQGFAQLGQNEGFDPESQNHSPRLDANGQPYELEAGFEEAVEEWIPDDVEEELEIGGDGS